MLEIIKVSSGIGADGSSEFSLSIFHPSGDNVFEVEIGETAYCQLVGVIMEVAEAEKETPASVTECVQEPINTSAEGRAVFHRTLDKTACSLEPCPVSMESVGFGVVDYSAEDEEEEDPGEGVEDDFVGQL